MPSYHSDQMYMGCIVYFISPILPQEIYNLNYKIKEP